MEYGKWNSGRAIPFLGIFVSNFWYSVCAVHPLFLAVILTWNTVDMADMLFAAAPLLFGQLRRIHTIYFASKAFSYYYKWQNLIKNVNSLLQH
jgi:hypothetical protein